jgi:hypothetical protein
LRRRVAPRCFQRWPTYRILFVDSAEIHGMAERIFDSLGIAATRDDENKYFLLYYQFLKHAFGLRYCNEDRERVTVSIYLDEVPKQIDRFANFRKYLSDLSHYPVFHNERITIPPEEITSVNSEQHVILQATDVILGSMQFRLNDKHLEKPKGSRVRGKKTRAKERIYKVINGRIRELYPNFNVGITTGREDNADRWEHPYRHWCFKGHGTVKDLSRGKKR